MQSISPGCNAWFSLIGNANDKGLHAMRSGIWI